MLVLLDEALASYDDAIRELGLPGPHRHRGGPHRSPAHQQLADAVAPLLLPEELDALWGGWELDSFVSLERQGSRLLQPEEILTLWPLPDGAPRVLLPIIQEPKWMVAIELASPEHPGSRLFELDQQAGARVFAVGIANLFEMITATITERRFSGLSTDAPQFWEPSWRRRSSTASQITQDGAAFLRPTEWPAHWRDAEGIDEAELSEKGHTHTVAEFIEARTTAEVLSGTLSGVFETKLAGGTLAGAIGFLTDDTGEIQIFVPDGIDEYGGPSGRVEIDVMASKPEGLSAEQLPEMPVGDDLDPEDYGRFMMELIAAMDDLDKSVVATAVRQIES